MAYSDSRIIKQQSKHDSNLEFIEEVFEGLKNGDTKVMYKGQTICCICGENIKEFDDKWKALIEEYRI